MKRTAFLLIPLLLFGLHPAAGSPSAADPETSEGKVRTLVIDAGHGGKDPGTHYGKWLEKNITLKIALLLGGMVERNLPDVKVIYTRKTDIYVPLAERGDIANKAGADLFISIHVDGVENPAAQGNSTFVMGMDKTKANLDVAMRENDVITYEEDYTSKYEGYIPGSTESFIIFSLMQYAHLDQSMKFARMVQDHYGRNTSLRDRGSRQAPYLVLWKTAMPSVLTEIGFITNASDRAFITSDAGQKKIARSIFNAFSAYKSEVEGKASPIQLSDEEPQTAARPTSAGKSGVYYCVQLCSSARKLKADDSSFGPWRGKVDEHRIKGSYKYTVGRTSSYGEAVALQNKVRTHIRDAFVVAWRGGEQIAVSEARKLTE